jgi:hypothetical protein
VRRALLLFLAAFLSGGSGPYTAALSPEDLHRIKTVAVISALGNSFVFEHVPDSALEALSPPASRFLEISDWKLDPLVARTLTARLSQRFTIKPIVFRPADFSSWNTQTLRHSALNLNGDPDIDAYVLVLRDWRADAIGNSGQCVGGLGLYRRDGARPRYGVFASYRIVVVDALTGETIASRAALTGGGKLPWAQADASLWPKTPNDLSAQQSAALAANERKLIDATLLPTLVEMNLSR